MNNYNPPAFPTPGKMENNGIRGPGFAEWFEPAAESGGMTLRDYFAAKASEEDIQEILNDYNVSKCPDRQTARFIHADAMLKARNPDSRPWMT